MIATEVMIMVEMMNQRTREQVGMDDVDENAPHCLKMFLEGMSEEKEMMSDMYEVMEQDMHELTACGDYETDEFILSEITRLTEEKKKYKKTKSKYAIRWIDKKLRAMRTQLRNDPTQIEEEFHVLKNMEIQLQLAILTIRARVQMGEEILEAAEEFQVDVEEQFFLDMNILDGYELLKEIAQLDNEFSEILEFVTNRSRQIEGFVEAIQHLPSASRPSYAL